MLRLFDFLPGSKGYAKTTLHSDEELAALFARVMESERDWVMDYDPLWREVVLYDPEGTERAEARLLGLVEAVGSEAGVTHRGPLGVEVPTRPAKAQAKRSYTRDGKTETILVELELEPGAPGSGLVIEARNQDFAQVLAHGVRRAVRFGPVAGFPVTDLEVKVGFTWQGEGSPALADMHAASTYACSRALAQAGLEARSPGDERAPMEVVTRFPDMENSAGETFANLRELFAYPLERLSEEEKTKLGGFVAYQVSMVFGHDLDEKMRRVPAVPPEARRPLLGHFAELLARQAKEDGRPGADMVLGLLDIWVEGWWHPLVEAEAAGAAEQDEEAVPVGGGAGKSEPGQVAGDGAQDRQDHGEPASDAPDSPPDGAGTESTPEPTTTEPYAFDEDDDEVDDDF